MSNIIEIKNLNFAYKNKKVYNDLSLNIAEGTFTTIIGNTGSGKSTLARIIYGLINSKSYIKVDNMFINPKNIKELRKKVGIVFENPDNQFISKTIKDDMILSLKKFEYNKSKIDEKIESVAELLGISELLPLEPHRLSGGEKQLVSLAIALAHEPKILILDDALNMIDSVKREKIYNILKAINKRGISIINITHNSEDLLKGTDIILISDGKILLQEKVQDAFNNPKLFTENNIDLPFVIDLSIKLLYYHAIDKIYFDIKKLVGALWK